MAKVLARFLRFLLTWIEKETKMSTDATGVVLSPNPVPGAGVAAADPAPAGDVQTPVPGADVAAAADPAPADDPSAVSVPPRPLDQIKADADAAQAAHQAAKDQVKATGGALRTLAAEYRAAVAYFSKDCAAIESMVATVVDDVEERAAALATKIEGVL